MNINSTRRFHHARSSQVAHTKSETKSTEAQRLYLGIPTSSPTPLTFSSPCLGSRISNGTPMTISPSHFLKRMRRHLGQSFGTLFLSSQKTCSGAWGAHTYGPGLKQPSHMTRLTKITLPAKKASTLSSSIGSSSSESSGAVAPRGNGWLTKRPLSFFVPS